MDDILKLIFTIIITTLVIGFSLLGFSLFINTETNQTTMSADNQQDTIISKSADTRAEEAQDSGNPTYVTNNYTYNSTGGDFLSDLSINVIAELTAAFMLGFLGNKVYSKIKLNKQKG